jgi:hypothetical protein
VPKVIYREVDNVDVAEPLRGFHRGLKLQGLEVATADGRKLHLELLTVEIPKRWILEKMRQEGLSAHYASHDFQGWRPHPVETFDQWGIKHDVFGASDLPHLELGDFLAMESNSGACAIYQVSAAAA